MRIDSDDRAGVERLVRYCARPPLALERLHAVDGQESLASPDAQLLYRLPEGDVHGRSGVLVTPLELLGHLAVLIPPPRDRLQKQALPAATATMASSLRTRASGPRSSRSGASPRRRLPPRLRSRYRGTRPRLLARI